MLRALYFVNEENIYLHIGQFLIDLVSSFVSIYAFFVVKYMLSVIKTNGFIFVSRKITNVLSEYYIKFRKTVQSTK